MTNAQLAIVVNGHPFALSDSMATTLLGALQIACESELMKPDGKVEADLLLRAIEAMSQAKPKQG